MKKAVLIYGLFLLATMVSAQQHEIFLTHGWNSSLKEKTGDYPNETGGGSLLGGVFAFLVSPEAGLNYILTTDRDYVIRQEVHTQSHFSLGYRFKKTNADQKPGKNSWGLNYTAATYQHDKTWSSGRLTSTNDRFTTIMADYRRSWLQLKNFQFYSGLGLGVTTHRMTGAVNQRRSFVGGQIIPLGLQAFHKNVGLQVECGYGARGSISAGAVVRMGR